MSRQIISTKLSPAAQNRRRIVLFGSIAVVAILIIVALALANRVPDSASQAPVISSLKVGDKAPEFSVSTTGGPFDLAVNGKAKPTLLEVFATWCPHCQREAPVISKLALQYKGRANIVGVAGSDLGIDHTTPETQADVYAWSEQFGATYPVAFDPNLDVAKKYMSDGFPTIVLIGSDGTVQAIRSGETPPKDIATALDAALAEKKPDPKMGFKG